MNGQLGGFFPHVFVYKCRHVSYTTHRVALALLGGETFQHTHLAIFGAEEFDPRCSFGIPVKLPLLE